LLGACGKQTNIQTKDLPTVGDYFSEVGGKHIFNSHLRGTKKLVLTYDDFYSETKTMYLLDLLERENVRATFFYNTTKKFNPASPVIQRIIRDGHILASHNEDHLSSTTNRGGHFTEKLTRSVLMIEKAYAIARDRGEANGDKEFGVYFRYPFGKKSSATYRALRTVGDNVYGNNCVNYAFWDIDTIDWALRNSKKIYKNIIAQLEGGKGYAWERGKVRSVRFLARRGGVILMHDLGNTHHSYEATEMTIKWAKNHGYEFVRLDEVEDFAFDGRRCEVKEGLLNGTYAAPSQSKTVSLVASEHGITLWKKVDGVLTPYLTLPKGSRITYRRNVKLSNPLVITEDGDIVESHKVFNGYILIKRVTENFLSEDEIAQLNHETLFILN
jgi:peptidoglycan/xylan/chitin deacetylase (PgdA/CDA1 family)